MDFFNTVLIISILFIFLLFVSIISGFLFGRKNKENIKLKRNDISQTSERKDSKYPPFEDSDNYRGKTEVLSEEEIDERYELFLSKDRNNSSEVEENIFSSKKPLTGSKLYSDNSTDSADSTDDFSENHHDSDSFTDSDSYSNLSSNSYIDSNPFIVPLNSKSNKPNDKKVRMERREEKVQAEQMEQKVQREQIEQKVQREQIEQKVQREQIEQEQREQKEYKEYKSIETESSLNLENKSQGQIEFVELKPSKQIDNFSNSSFNREIPSANNDYNNYNNQNNDNNDNKEISFESLEFSELSSNYSESDSSSDLNYGSSLNSNS
ncbi:MAG: hypothetical protein GX362_02470, partial [Methanosarcinaceae archaeon]|nr:hypothetical protein [Methanosarcinaceae archaeon]